MSKFKRKFDMDVLEGVVDAPENRWFRDLLKYWRPAGGQFAPCDSPADADHLTLAIRGGYLNFYRAGQSVAKVSITAGSRKLCARVHKKYVFGEGAPDPNYVLVRDGGITAADGSRIEYCEQLLRNWIRAAGGKEYVKGEKEFVDGLVAGNPGVIDLEAGLHWDQDIWEKKAARRIDIVALEGGADRYKLVFWEAKLVANSEARSRKVPEVFEQLQRYHRWLTKYQDDVCKAYHHTCGVLARMHAIAKTRRLNECELGSAVLAVARQDPAQLELDDQPRLVIDDTQDNAAFTANGHLEKLRELGIPVQLVRRGTAMKLMATA